MTLLIDPSDSELKTKIEKLPPSFGYCIFIDIVDSTRMKQSNRSEWVSLIYNIFTNANMYLGPFRPLKSVGDEIMYYITDEELSTREYSPLQIFDALAQLTKEADRLFKPIKIGAARCMDVFAMTFLSNTNDYYGRDIDLTARLLSQASESELVINEQFRDIIMTRYNETGNKEQFASVKCLQGPWPVMLKGFDSYINIYKLPKRS